MNKFLTLLFILMSQLSVFAQTDNVKFNKLLKCTITEELVTAIGGLNFGKSTEDIGNVVLEGELKSELIPSIEYHQYNLDLVIPYKSGDYDYWGVNTHQLEVLSTNGALIFKRLRDSKGNIVAIEKSNLGKQSITAKRYNQEKVWGGS